MKHTEMQVDIQSSKRDFHDVKQILSVCVLSISRSSSSAEDNIIFFIYIIA